MVIPVDMSMWITEITQGPTNRWSVSAINVHWQWENQTPPGNPFVIYPIPIAHLKTHVHINTKNGSIACVCKRSNWRDGDQEVEIEGIGWAGQCLKLTKQLNL